MAADDASFNISMDSISFGLIVTIPLLAIAPFWFPSAIAPAPTGNPSITYKGSLLLEREFPPRTRMETWPPGAPDVLVTCTPAALPWIPWSKEVIGNFCNSSDLIDDTAPVKSLFLTVP